MIPFLHRTFALATMTLASATTAALADWEKLPSLPEPNGGFACGIVDGEIVVIGGTNWQSGEKLWLDSVRRFHPGTKTWRTTVKLDSPFAYGPFGSRGVDDTLVVLGGSDGKAPRISLVTIAEEKAETTAIAEFPKQVVLGAGGIIVDRFLVVGGTDDAANIAGMTRRAFCYDLTDKSVKQLPDYPGKPFAISASAVVGEELFVFGGANWDAASETVSNTTACFAYSVGTGQWRRLKPFPLDVRGHAAVALNEHRIYIAGGYGDEPAGFLDQAFIYDLRTDSYAEAKPLPYAASAGLVVLDGYLYCIGGEDRMKSRSDSFWRIRLEKLLP